MNQTQLLALDSILPTILGLGGLIFVAAALWPIGRDWPKRDRVAASGIGIVGLACLAAGVWLWLLLYNSEGHVLEVAPGTSVTTVVSVPASPAARASAPAAASGVVSPAAVPTSGTTASTASASPASSASSSVAPTPTLALTPVASVAFQPDTTAHGAVVAVEPFERGFMIYRDDTKQDYVLSQDKTFKVYPDTWVEGQNPDLAGKAPDGVKLVPGRGFGWLWASDPDVRNTLGYAVGKEMGLTASVSGDGASTTIRADAVYILHKDGTWNIGS
ncbi:MAG: hypothetical protein JO247_22595 [Chloroflexi bacterium]|nr:hypothetical protein [Chloroflexota bacterium]